MWKAHHRSRARRLIGGAAVLALVALGAVTGAQAASAATVTPNPFTVSVSTTTPGEYDPFQVRTSFCVPDNTPQGDTFTLTLPDVLKTADLAFPLNDPNGIPIANVVTSNGVATFTMTDYATTHRNVCGSAEFTVTIDHTRYNHETVLPLTFQTNTSVTITINPRPVTGYYLTEVTKSGSCTTTCGSTNPSGGLSWGVNLPAAPAGGYTDLTISDTVGPNQRMECGVMYLVAGPPDGAGGVANQRNVPFTKTACTDSGFTVNVTEDIPAGDAVSLYYTTTPTDAWAAGTYTNAATVTMNKTVTQSDEARIVNESGSGNGSGDNITIKKFSTADGVVDGDFNSAPGKSVPANTPIPLTFVITNAGVTDLRDVVVSDAVSSGPAVQNLSCDFSRLGGPATGVTWAGPFASGASFSCTATVPGMTAGTQQADTASVVGTGNARVTASDPFHATVPPAPTPTPTPTPSVTPTPTPTPSPTPTPTPSDTPSPTPSSTPSDTPSTTPSATPSPSPTQTASATPCVPSPPPGVTPPASSDNVVPPCGSKPRLATTGNPVDPTGPVLGALAALTLGGIALAIRRRRQQQS